MMRVLEYVLVPAKSMETQQLLKYLNKGNK